MVISGNSGPGRAGHLNIAYVSVNKHNSSREGEGNVLLALLCALIKHAHL